jgi:hypothetical protein
MAREFSDISLVADVARNLALASAVGIAVATAFQRTLLPFTPSVPGHSANKGDTALTDCAPNPHDFVPCLLLPTREP